MGNVLLVKDKVQRYLTDRGLHVTLSDSGFQVPYESTAVNIGFLDLEDRVLVQCWAPVLRDVRESNEVFRWIAVEGHKYLFGHCAWNPYPDRPGEGIITFDHTLLGDYLDFEELWQTLGALATTADELDEQLQSKFGGKRFTD